jgi:hypothetical protein
MSIDDILVIIKVDILDGLIEFVTIPSTQIKSAFSVSSQAHCIVHLQLIRIPVSILRIIIIISSLTCYIVNTALAMTRLEW